METDQASHFAREASRFAERRGSEEPRPPPTHSPTIPWETLWRHREGAAPAHSSLWPLLHTVTAIEKLGESGR